MVYKDIHYGLISVTILGLYWSSMPRPQSQAICRFSSDVFRHLSRKQNYGMISEKSMRNMVKLFKTHFTNMVI